MVPPSTGLPPAAWSADADVGAARRNPVPYRDHRDVLRADAPPQARWATSNSMELDGGSESKRRGGCRTGPHGPVRRPGNPPGLVMPPSRGAWRCKRGRGHSLAVRTKRNAGNRGAPKPCSRPLPDDRHAAAAAWVGSVRRQWALSQHCCGSARLAQARQRIAHQHSATPRPPRAARCGPGARLIMCRDRATPLDALSGRVARGCRARAGAATASHHRV